MKNYLFNFFLWWYLINGRKIFEGMIANWGYSLESLKIVPMLNNFFMPLFQDYTWEGKLIAIPFRFIWVIFGLLFQFVYSILLIFVFVIYLLIPFIPFVIIIYNFVK